MLTNDKDWVGPWVTDRTGDDFPGGVTAAIGLIDDNDGLVAGVVYDHYTEACVTATMAVEKKMLTRKMIRAMFRYPFEQLGVNKIIAYANSANQTAVDIIKKLGFTLEAQVKDVYPDGDMLILGLVKSDCVWLER
jgi:RimJ/RimL family protein N-acetyltransferase